MLLAMTRPDPTPALNAIVNSYARVGFLCTSAFITADALLSFRRSYENSDGRGHFRVTIYDFTIADFGFGEVHVTEYNESCGVDVRFDNITLGDDIRYSAYYESRHGGFGLMTFLNPLLLAKLQADLKILHPNMI